MLKPLISVVMPVYNRPQYLREAIESVLSQEYSHYDLILVDDGSTEDEVQRILETYRNHPNIVILRKENGGPGSAMNYGAAQVRGDYFCRLDSDDLLTPNALSVVSEYLEKYPEVSYFYSSRYVIDEDSNRVASPWVSTEDGRHPSDVFERERLFKEFFCNHLVCWNKKDYLAAGGMREDLMWSEDWEFALRMAERYPFQNISEALYLVREYAGDRLSCAAGQDERKQISQQIRYEAQKKEILRRTAEYPFCLERQRLTKKKKTALFINNVVELYGGELSLFEMVASLKDYTPIVVLPRKGPLQELLEAQGIQVLYHDLEVKWEPFKRDLNTYRFLEETIDRYEVDVVHLNKAFNFLEEARIVTWLKHIPLICHVRGQIQIGNALKYWLSQMDQIVFVSEDAKQYLISDPGSEMLRGLLPRSIEVVHDGRDLIRYEFSKEKRACLRDTFGFSGDDIVVTLVGYFDPLKGQDRFVELAAKLLDSSKRFKFVLAGGMVGTLHQAYYEQVVDRIKELGLTDSFCLPGYVDAPELLSATDFLVSLSNTEGLPGIVMEAMAASRVVIANRVGGIPEIMGDEGAGFCVPQNNLEQMKKHILSLASDAEARNQIGNKAKDRVLSLFGIEKHVRQMESIFEYARIEKICQSLGKERRSQGATMKSAENSGERKSQLEVVG